ncbi:hypothetical protein PSA7680_00198 [Pseudoruegeria aquimaris]|uniref:DUF177 domain-containing protein n=1 Tax=Pseudoruegeria aquimaris TaxID=393663 RepID=A0A1Y5RDK5_9RHOB|nr:YceD family protein [Pseudoruegeria aquimaris]SLN12420.1 hypothetical protein PSA7680_00198 [Pseudoruegeria aquimaris]
MTQPEHEGHGPKRRWAVAELSQKKPTRFRFEPSPEERAALAEEMGISAVRKLRFEGELKPRGKRDWILEAHLGATVVQPCVVTLEPVSTRLEEDVRRHFSADCADPDEEEVELADDDGMEPLGEVIDAGAVMAEALALALPLYPRASGAALEAAQFTEPGKAPMTDEEARPFAALSALRDSLKKGEN